MRVLRRVVGYYGQAALDDPHTLGEVTKYVTRENVLGRVSTTLGEWDHMVEVEVGAGQDVESADVAPHPILGKDHGVVGFGDDGAVLSSTSSTDALSAQFAGALRVRMFPCQAASLDLLTMRGVVGLGVSPDLIRMCLVVDVL